MTAQYKYATNSLKESARPNNITTIAEVESKRPLQRLYGEPETALPCMLRQCAGIFGLSSTLLTLSSG